MFCWEDFILFFRLKLFLVIFFLVCFIWLEFASIALFSVFLSFKKDFFFRGLCELLFIFFSIEFLFYCHCCHLLSGMLINKGFEGWWQQNIWRDGKCYCHHFRIFFLIIVIAGRLSTRQRNNSWKSQLIL